MHSKIYELLDNKPCDILCEQGPFMIAVKCDKPGCTYSELLPVSEMISQTPNFCEIVQGCVDGIIAEGIENWFNENVLELNCGIVTNCLINNGIPTGVQLFTLNGTPYLAGGNYTLNVGSNVTVGNTNSLNLSIVSNNITGTVRISTDSGNLLQSTINGLYVNAAAIAHTYDNSVSGLTATNVQAAINELNTAINNSGGGFTITDLLNSQSIAPGNTITFLGQNLIRPVVSATDTVTIGFNTTGATNGQVPTFNGTAVVWGTPDASTNIYTDDGILADNRNVDLDLKSLKFYRDGLGVDNFINFAPNGPTRNYLGLPTTTGQSIVFNTGAEGPDLNDSVGSIGVWDGGSGFAIQGGFMLLINSNDLILNSEVGSYTIKTTPTTATTQTKVLVRDDATGRLYLKDLATTNATRYATTITPVANTQQVVTHNMNNSDVIVQVRDATTNTVVDVDIEILSANTIGITSTTTDQLRVVVL